MEEKLQQYDSQSYHYEFLGYTKFDDVLNKLNASLPFYNFSKAETHKTTEIFYDAKSNLLYSGGIVCSKFIDNDKASLTIRKLSHYKAMRNFNKKFHFTECKIDDEPKDYAFQMASLIINSFRTPFSVDLESIVRQTEPIVQIDMVYDEYNIFCGTGYKATMQYEKMLFIDLEKGKKVEKEGLTFKFPLGDAPEKEEILKVIDRNIPGIALNDLSRYEIAMNILNSSSKRIIEDEEEDEEGEDNDEDA